MRPLILLSVLLALCAPSAAFAQDKMPERLRLETLLQNVLAAGRAEAERAAADPRVPADDRRDTQTQYARLLIQAGDCRAAQAFIAAHPEIRASGVERSVSDARSRGERVCATRLARIMYERSEDPYIVRDGRPGLQFLAAAYLDAGGEADGATLREAADEAMKAVRDGALRWQPRFDAIAAYQGTQKLNSYLEYLAGKLADPNDSPLDSTRSGIYAIFALYGRCDLVQQASAPKRNDCAEAKAAAKDMYIEPSPSMVASAQNLNRLFGGDITTDEAGLRQAVSKPTLFWRMAMLNLIAARARDELSKLP